MTTGSTHKVLRTTTAILPALLIFSSPTIAEEAFEDLGPNGGGHMMHHSQTILSADGTSVAGTDGDYMETRAFRWANGMKTSLGTLGGTNSSASAISADGAVVVGNSNTAGNSERHAFRWFNGNMADLGTLGGTHSYARAVSADGAVVVGNSNTAGNSESHAFRWVNGNMADLGTLGGTYSYANAVSADGAVVVGYSYTTGNSEQRAFRWFNGNMADLGTLGGTHSDARAVSADGAVVVGNSNTAGNSESHAFRWVNGNMADLGTLGGTYSYANAVSADGAVVVGYSYTTGNSEHRAFRWVNGNMADLGTLGGTYSYANAVSADGAVVVGYSYTTGNSEQRAFRWNDIKGLQSVADWVVEEGGTVPLDYALHNAIGVSADGTIVVGTGRYNNENVAWLARGNGFLRDTAAFDRSVIQTGTAAVSSAMTVTDLALNGAHHRALWEMGFQVTPTGWFGWTTADRAKNDYFDAKTTLLETGIGRDIGEYRIGFAIGTSKTRQDWDLGGNAKVESDYILAEINRAFTIAGGSTVQASLLGYYASFDTELHRAYASGAGTDISSGSPNLTSSAIKAKVDWVNAAKLGNVAVSPYAALTLSNAKVDAYTETGGAFPASYGETSTDSGNLRIGAAFTIASSNALKMRVGIEGVHQFDDGAGDVNGEVTGLYAFNLNGEERKSNWARVTLDADYALSSSSALTGGISMATQGSQPTVGVTFGLRAAF